MTAASLQNARENETSLRASILSMFATPVARIPHPTASVFDDLVPLLIARAAEDSKPLATKTETLYDLQQWQDPLIGRLTRWVEKSAETFVEAVRKKPLNADIPAQLGSTDPVTVSIRAARSWASFYTRGDHHTAHFHPNTAISAIYYLAANDTCELDLLDPRANVDFFDPGMTYANEGTTVRLSCTPGELVLIPGWLKHSVPPFDDQGTRISMSWNLSYVFSENADVRPAGD
jgi:uncharacterized protein (TIGR02466 family)